MRFVEDNYVVEKLAAAASDPALRNFKPQLEKLAMNPWSAPAGVFYEVVHQRYRHGSAILASNLGVNDWTAALGGPSLLHSIPISPGRRQLTAWLSVSTVPG